MPSIVKLASLRAATEILTAIEKLFDEQKGDSVFHCSTWRESSLIGLYGVEGFNLTGTSPASPWSVNIGADAAGRYIVISGKALDFDNVTKTSSGEIHVLSFNSAEEAARDAVDWLLANVQGQPQQKINFEDRDAMQPLLEEIEASINKTLAIYREKEKYPGEESTHTLYAVRQKQARDLFDLLQKVSLPPHLQPQLFYGDCHHQRPEWMKSIIHYQNFNIQMVLDRLVGHLQATQDHVKTLKNFDIPVKQRVDVWIGLCSMT